jgi:hypothetical protein
VHDARDGAEEQEQEHDGHASRASPTPGVASVGPAADSEPALAEQPRLLAHARAYLAARPCARRYVASFCIEILSRTSRRLLRRDSSSPSRPTGSSSSGRAACRWALPPRRLPMATLRARCPCRTLRRPAQKDVRDWATMRQQERDRKRDPSSFSSSSARISAPSP